LPSGRQLSRHGCIGATIGHSSDEAGEHQPRARIDDRHGNNPEIAMRILGLTIGAAMLCLSGVTASAASLAPAGPVASQASGLVHSVADWEHRRHHRHWRHRHHRDHGHRHRHHSHRYHWRHSQHHERRNRDHRRHHNHHHYN
jgi:hypothetical protein